MVLGQLHSLCELQIHAIEQPLGGDCICVAGQDHGILVLCDYGVAGLDGGLSHRFCGETENMTE